MFHPSAQPSNAHRVAIGDSKMAERTVGPAKDAQKTTEEVMKETVRETAEDQTLSTAQEEDRMDLHRALVRGTGFYEWMTKAGLKSLPGTMEFTSPVDPPVHFRPLPVVNFLDIDDTAYADSIVEEALPHDRARFRVYLSSRPLGLGIISGVSIW